MSEQKNDGQTMLAKMMGGFGDADQAVTAEVTQFATVPYVQFAQPRATDAWAKMVAVFPKLQEGQPILLMPQPNPMIDLDPFRYFLIAAQQYWCRENSVGKVLHTQFDATLVTGDMREYIDTVILVQAPEGVNPGLIMARCCFKQTKVPGVNPALNALKIAKKPEWLELSEAHAATASIPDPRFRFVTEVRMVDRVSQDEEQRPYVTCEAMVEPTTTDEFQELLTYMETEEAQKAQATIRESYDKRIFMMKKMIKR